MSRTARDFLRLMHWCNWQDEMSVAGIAAHPLFREQDAKLRRDAAYLIGYMA